MGAGTIIHNMEPDQQQDLNQPIPIKPKKHGDSSIVTVKKIIDQARNRPIPMVSALKLSLLTGGLFYASFHPLNLFFLAWIAFVPVLTLIQIPKPTSRMYLAIYLGGLLQFLPALQWMRLADPMMYIAWGVLSIYLAVYLPLFVGISRIGIHRMKLPLVLVVPAVWTAGEVLRSYLFTGFAWYFVGHTQYRWLELIQISDLTGSYGVSFIILMVNAAIANMLPAGWYQFWKLTDQEPAQEFYQGLANSSSRRVMQQITVTLIMLGMVLGYGFLRRSQAHFTPGPRVALAQGSVPASLNMNSENPSETFHVHQALTAQCVMHQPDLIVWPEGMFRWPLMSRHPKLSDEQLQKVSGKIPVSMWADYSVQRSLQEISERANATLIIGIMSFDADPTGVSHHNSAVFVDGKQGITGRYDKQHLVIFGEYIPLLESLPFLSIFNPIATEFMMKPGLTQQVFKQGSWEYLPDICYEDTVPRLISRSLYASSTDQTNKIFVNLSNDGWFHGSSEHDQHLITSVFRAVENRTPLVRAVNMGISGIIDGDGAIREPEHFIDGEALGEERASKARKSMRDPQTGTFHRKIPLAMVSTVPLDSRNSFYSLAGDWFGYLCWCFVGLLLGVKFWSKK